MKLILSFLLLIIVQEAYAQKEEAQRLEVADSIMFYGRDFGIDTDSELAIEIYNSIKDKAYEDKRWDLYFEALSRYIDALLYTSQSTKAIPLSEQMLKHIDSLNHPDPAPAALAYSALFFKGYSSGGLDRAILYLDSAMSIIEKSDDKFHPLFYKPYSLKALVNRQFRNFKQMNAYFELAYKSDPDQKRFNQRISEYIESHRLIQNYERALELADQYILRVNEVLDENSRSYASALKLKGQVFIDQNEYLNATKYFQQALHYYEKNKAKNLKQYTSLSIDLGTCYLWTGLYDKAEKYFLEGIEISEKNSVNNDFRYYQKVALNNLVVLYNMQEKYELAKEYQQIVLSLSEENPSPLSIAEYYDTMGLVYHNLNELDSAILYYNKSLAIWREAVGTDHYQYLQTINKLSRTYQRKGEFNRVIDLATEVRQNLKATQGDNYRVFLAFYNPLAFAHYKLGDTDSAKAVLNEDKNFYINYIKQYFDQLSEVQRQKFYDTFSEFMNAYKTFCIAEGKNDQALLSDFFNFQEETKGILLNTSLAIRSKIERSGNEKSLEIFNTITELQKEIGKYALIEKEKLIEMGLDLDSLEDKLTNLESDLASLSSAYAKEEMKFSKQEVLNKLKKNEAVIDIIRTEAYDFQKLKSSDSIIYGALIIKKKDPIQLVVLENGTELENFYIKGYSNSIKYKIQDRYSYDALWKPIEDKLGEADKIMLLADGIFHKVNLNTIYNPYKNNYLFDAYQINKISSLSDVFQKDRSSTSNKNLILIGNPDYGTASGNRKNSVVPLPGTQIEIQSIVNLTTEKKGYSTEVYVDKEASEENFKSIKAPYVLHIATHGFFSAPESRNKNLNPLNRSGLLLSDANYFLNDTQKDSSMTFAEDGVLTAYEAQTINVYGTELVVLSACETGLGDIKNSQGVYGLQRSFKKAGANRLIMSLWKVNDETTQRMMTEFYKLWLSGESMEKSFRKAQQSIKAEFSDPYYWGAFELI